MNFLKDLAKKQEGSGSDQPDLMSSAKVVAEAARSATQRDADSIDKGKVAAAAGDLLHAANEYGNLDQNKQFGQYVQQAESYLQQYGSSGTEEKHSPPPETEQKPEKEAEDTDSPTDETPKPKPKPKSTTSEEVDVGEDKPSAAGADSGIGDYVKLAQGLVSNSSGGGDEKGSGDGGVGGYLKLAEGFMK